jgi:hypothetical protein
MIGILLILGNEGITNRLRDLISQYPFVGVDMASNNLPVGLVTTPCRISRLLRTIFHAYVDRLKPCHTSDNPDARPNILGTFIHYVTRRTFVLDVWYESLH